MRRALLTAMAIPGAVALTLLPALPAAAVSDSVFVYVNDTEENTHIAGLSTDGTSTITELAATVEADLFGIETDEETGYAIGSSEDGWGLYLWNLTTGALGVPTPLTFAPGIAAALEVDPADLADIDNSLLYALDLDSEGRLLTLLNLYVGDTPVVTVATVGLDGVVTPVVDLTASLIGDDGSESPQGIATDPTTDTTYVLYYTGVSNWVTPIDAGDGSLFGGAWIPEWTPIGSLENDRVGDGDFDADGTLYTLNWNAQVYEYTVPIVVTPFVTGGTPTLVGTLSPREAGNGPFNIAIGGPVPPTPAALADTGLDATGIVIAGLGLIAAGAAAVGLTVQGRTRRVQA